MHIVAVSYHHQVFSGKKSCFATYLSLILPKKREVRMTSLCTVFDFLNGFQPKSFTLNHKWAFLTNQNRDTFLIWIFER